MRHIPISHVGQFRNITFLACADELTKIAEAETEKQGPPKWLSKGINLGAFAVGAGVGSVVGNQIASKMLKITNPNIKNVAKATGAGVSGVAAMIIAPKVKAKLDKMMKE